MAHLSGLLDGTAPSGLHVSEHGPHPNLRRQKFAAQPSFYQAGVVELLRQPRRTVRFAFTHR
jgi:hypothetical protein